MKQKKQLIALLLGISFSAGAQINPSPTPEWAENLIIYEIATKSFNSPTGPESEYSWMSSPTV